MIDSGTSIKHWIMSFAKHPSKLVCTSITKEILSKCLLNRCEICKKSFHKNDFSSHYHGKRHIRKVYNILLELAANKHENIPRKRQKKPKKSKKRKKKQKENKKYNEKEKAVD